MLEIAIFIIVAAIVIAVIAGFAQGAKINEFRSELMKEFPDAKIHVSHNDSSFLVVDFSNEQIVVGLRKARGTIFAQEQPYRTLKQFSEVVKAEVLRDGTQVASTNRGSQVLGAAVGAITFGGIGAIVGGLSGSSTSLSGTKRLSLRITVEDASKPLHEVTFYETDRKKGGKRGEIFFDQGAQQASEFAAHLEAAIRKADGRQSMNMQALKPPFAEKSTADQIKELWELKEAGALTQDEFNMQKSKLIKG